MFFKEKRVDHKWAFNEMVLYKNANAELNKPFFFISPYAKGQIILR